MSRALVAVSSDALESDGCTAHHHPVGSWSRDLRWAVAACCAGFLLGGCPVSECDLDGDGHLALECGGDDCDDDDPATRPGALEVCGDGAVNDCGPWTRECGLFGPLRPDSGPAVFAFDGDGLTAPTLTPVGDWDGDGVEDLAIGNRFAGGDDGPGRVWVHGGPFEGLAEPGGALLEIRGGAAEMAGSALTWLPELRGGAALAVGSEGFEDAGVGGVGAVSFVPAGAGGVVALADQARVVGAEAFDRLGRTLTRGPDREGSDTLLVGVPSGLDMLEGEVLLATEAPGQTIDRDELSLLFINDVPGMAGFQSLGLLGGDHLVVGLPQLMAQSELVGGVVVAPIGTEAFTTSQAPVRLYGAQPGDHFGWRVAAGDLDGDGVADLAVSAPQHRSGGRLLGAVWLYFGSEGATWTFEETSVLVTGPGLDGGGSLDADLAVVGDLDGNGYPELAVGAPHADPARRGCLYLFYGPLDRIVTFDDHDASICGVHDGEQLGVGARGLGDLDGDGYGDLAVASYRRVYVLRGGPGP